MFSMLSVHLMRYAIDVCASYFLCQLDLTIHSSKRVFQEDSWE